ncbi:MAG: hypothetical protein J0M17_22185 [Planctomycetes bacterium]|nr:hypothetical protein [Planctomycetota bacterium]
MRELSSRKIKKLRQGLEAKSATADVQTICAITDSDRAAKSGAARLKQESMEAELEKLGEIWPLLPTNTRAAIMLLLDGLGA